MPKSERSVSHRQFVGGFIGGAVGYLGLIWLSPLAGTIGLITGFIIGFAYEQIPQLWHGDNPIANMLRAAREMNKPPKNDVEATRYLIRARLTALFIGAVILSVIEALLFTLIDVGNAKGGVITIGVLVLIGISALEGVRVDQFGGTDARRARMKELGFYRYTLWYLIRVPRAYTLVVATLALLAIPYLLVWSLIFLPMFVIVAAFFYPLRLMMDKHLGSSVIGLAATTAVTYAAFHWLAPHVPSTYQLLAALCVGTISGMASATFNAVILGALESTRMQTALTRFRTSRWDSGISTATKTAHIAAYEFTVRAGRVLRLKDWITDTLEDDKPFVGI